MLYWIELEYTEIHKLYLLSAGMCSQLVSF